MTDITEMAQREKFEAWWERTQHNGNPPRFGWECWRDGEGYKVDDDESELDGMWEAWKAAGAELVEALEAAQQRISELTSENAALKGRVENAAGCINAAYFEGLSDVLAESSDDRLVDLVKRRLLFAYLPVETPATNEEIIAMGDWVLREQLEDGTRAIKLLNQRIAELESRTVTVKLPDYRNTYKSPLADEVEHQVRLALELFSSAAGIKWEAE